MAYTKTNWASGDLITQAKMNKIEDQLEAVDSSIRYNIAQNLTERQKAQARENIGASDMTKIVMAQDTQPTDDDNKVWFNTGSIQEYNIPQIDDDNISTTDTWSSNKINNEVSDLENAFNNANAFAITSYAIGAKGTIAGSGLYVNNYTIEGTGVGNVVLSGNPSILPTTTDPASLEDAYYSIPLTSGITYTLALLVAEQWGSGELISVAVWDKTNKTRRGLYSFTPNTKRDTIVTSNFTVTTTDSYLLSVNLTRNADKTVKIAIYPKDCAYQQIATIKTNLTSTQTGVTGLTERMENVEAKVNGIVDLEEKTYLDGMLSAYIGSSSLSSSSSIRCAYANIQGYKYVTVTKNAGYTFAIGFTESTPQSGSSIFGYVRNNKGTKINASVPENCNYIVIEFFNQTSEAVANIGSMYSSINITGLVGAIDSKARTQISTLTTQFEAAGKLESTGDATDRTDEILARLTANGYCELDNGEFVVANLQMPAGTELRGQGYATVLKLDPTLTSGSAVIMKSRCTVRDLTLVGSDTDISFTSNSERPTKMRHGISIAAKPVEDAHISNIRIYRFAGYGIEALYKYTVADTTLKSIVFSADNCSIDGCFAGFAVSPNVKNCYFNHCCCSNGRKGADLYGECFVSDCIFTDNVINVNVTGGGAKLMNCVFHDKNSPSECALRLYSISKTTSISGCEFYNCGSIQSNSPTANGIFIGCSFNTITLPIQCDGTSASGFGLLFMNCMFSAKVTDSGNIEEATEGIVRLKNCYQVSSGNLVDLMER